jgi:hypothetical protein
MSPINFEDDAVTNLKQDELEDIASLLQRQLKAELDVELAEADLKNKKEQFRKLSEEIIPARMTELGMTSTEMSDGSKVEVVEYIQARIPVRDEEKKAKCHQWLEQNGLGDLLKNEVTMNFGRGEDQQAKQLEETIRNMGYIPQVKVSVPWNTLEAALVKWHQDGNNVPDDLFQWHVGQRTKITRQKKKN